MKKWNLGLCLLAALLLTHPLAQAQNTPCSGKKGGVSHCQDGKFVCKDGSISQSRRVCTQ